MLDRSPPDAQIFNEIIQARRNFLGIMDWGHPRYPVYDYPQRLCLLSDMNRVYILREIGDTQKFIEYEEQINAMPGKEASPQDKCTLDMAYWTDNAIKTMQSIESEKEKVIICLLAYGKEYLKKCIDLMLKSLMSEGNLPTLCKEKQPIFYIQTDKAGKETLENAPIVGKIKELGVLFEYVIIPDSLIEQIDIQSIYWLVGAAATVGIEYARANNAVFHHSYPDIIYSNNFFSELLRLSKGHKSILSPAHRTDEAVLIPNLKPYENDECLSIPSSDLVALSLNCLHMCHYPTLINNRPHMWSYPQHHYIMWETHEFVHFNCPHLNAIWLSAETISKAPQRFYISLDSELDFMCEGENYYIPQENDDLYLIEFSNQGKAKVEDLYVDHTNYANYFWKLSTNRDNFKFFVRGMKLRINRDIRPIKNAEPWQVGNVMDDEGAMSEKVFLINVIQSKDPGVGTTLTRPRTHVNRIYGITKTVHVEKALETGTIPTCA